MKIERHCLTQNRLKDFVHYNPKTGVFTRKTNESSNARAGDIAGHITSTGYISFAIAGYQYQAHRLAFLYMTGEFPKHNTDHINHDRQDNRWCNLRDATQSENLKNSRLRSDNTSGICGVNFNNKSLKWESKIMSKGKQIYLGSFDDVFEAICIRKSHESKLEFHRNHGEKP